MSEYGKYTTYKPAPLLSYDPIKEKKEARKKLLEQVEQRRRLNYIRWLRQSRLQSNSEIDTIV